MDGAPVGVAMALGDRKGQMPEETVLGRCDFPPAPAAVHVAVSGGADSLALLVLAVAARLDVTAHHVDHGLRPGSAAEAGLVASAAAALGAAFVAHAVKVEAGPNLEARARRERYRVLPAGILTGHTADDQAETVLLNVLRGAALDGLAGMRGSVVDGLESGGLASGGPAARGLTSSGPPVGRPAVGRPLLALRRSETRQVCRQAGLTPLEDPSNDNVALTRNALRHQVLPLMASIAGRDLVPVLARQAALLADDAAALDAMAATVDPTEAAALAAAPPALGRRAVRRWLREGSDDEHHPPSLAEVERVLAVARGDAVGTELAGGRRVRRSGGRLRVEPRGGPAPGPGRMRP